MVTRYYAVYQRADDPPIEVDHYSIKPFALLGDAITTKPYLILESKEHYKTGTTSDYEYRMYGLGLSMNNTMGFFPDFPLKIAEWKLLNAKALKSFYDTEEIGFDVADPTGELRHEFFGKAITANGIVKAILFLRKVSKFKDWKDYDSNRKHRK